MAEMLVPVGVARTVCDSQWYTVNIGAPDGTAIGMVTKAFARATEGRYKRNLPLFTSEIYQAMIDALVEIRAEDGLKMTEAGALEKFTGTVQRWLDQRLKVEQQEAKERAAREAKDNVLSRQWATEHRERPLSPLVESQRFEQLKQITEDYGLDKPNPGQAQIWAGLVAAFRAGANSLNRANTHLLMANSFTIDQESWDKRFAKDAERFEKAREAAKAKGEDA